MGHFKAATLELEVLVPQQVRIDHAVGYSESSVAPASLPVALARPEEVLDLVQLGQQLARLLSVCTSQTALRKWCSLAKPHGSLS